MRKSKTQTRLDFGNEHRPTRSFPDATGELSGLGFERKTLSPEEVQFSSHTDRGSLSRYDPPSHDKQNNEPHTKPEAAPHLHAAILNRRNRALRARGLEAISPSAGTMGLRVTTSPSFRPRQTQTGYAGGQTQARAHSLKACFTIRSSPE